MTMTKFKDKKTGIICDDILDAYYWYKCPGPCIECGLSSGSKCSEDWIESHPITAAEIMGLEIISEDIKPNLARILGVEIGQRFMFDTNNVTVWHITNDGRIVDDNDMPMEAAALLLEMIQNPNKIKICRNNWTNAEIENAKAIKRLFKEAKTIERYCQFDNTESIKISSIQSPILTNLDKNLFPSAKRHVTYYIDEIIKEGEY